MATTHDDVLLDRVFEPIAAWTTRHFGIGCFVLGNIFLVLALALLVYAGRVWWLAGPPTDFLTWSFVAPLIATAALIVNIAIHVGYLEKVYRENPGLRPTWFRRDPTLCWYRFFTFTSGLTLALLIFADHHDPYTRYWEMSSFPMLIGLYFLSCSRLLPEPKQKIVQVSQ